MKFKEYKGLDLPTGLSALSQHPKVIMRIQKEIDEFNKKFGKWEQIKKFELTPETWSIELGLLTPTMKMKRKIIKAHYQSLIDKIYA